MRKRHTVHLFILTLIFTMLISSCKKDKTETKTTTSTGAPIPAPSLETGPPHLRANVHVMDSLKYVLDTSPAQINAGIYKFSFSVTNPDIRPGDVIVGVKAGGYIRKVLTVTNSTGVVELTTLPGKMNDVFSSGTFNFDLDLGGMPGSLSSDGFSYPITNKTLIQDPQVTYIINSGRIDYNPVWNIYFEFNTRGVNKFEMKSKSGSLIEDINTSVTMTYTGQAYYQPAEIVIRKLSKQFVKWVLADSVMVPVPVRMDIDLTYEYTGSYQDSSSITSGLKINHTLNTNIKYETSQWSGGNSMYLNSTFTTTPFNKNSNTYTDFALIPKTRIYFYDNQTVELTTKPMAEIEGSGTIDYYWNYAASNWVEVKADVNPVIFDYLLSAYTKTVTTYPKKYEMPRYIKFISGLNQNGPALTELPVPIKLQVLDSDNNPVSQVSVIFGKAGGGSLSNASVLSDKDGFAETKWTLGPNGEQVLYVTIRAFSGIPSQITATITN